MRTASEVSLVLSIAPAVSITIAPLGVRLSSATVMVALLVGKLVEHGDNRPLTLLYSPRSVELSAAVVSASDDSLIPVNLFELVKR